MVLVATLVAAPLGGQCSFVGSGLITSTAVAAQLGSSVALGNGLLVTGAPWESNGWSGHGGVIYIYGGQPFGSYSQLQRLIPGEADSERFGWDVAVDGDRIAVGAPVGSSGSHGMTGKVFLYQRGGGLPATWYPLVPNGLFALNGRWLGYSVALQGQILVAGSPAYWGSFEGQGAVFIFGENNGGSGQWGLIARLDTPSPELAGRFGADVALVGQTLYVAAPGERRVYAFEQHLGGSNNWGLADTIEAPGTLDQYDYFATSLAAITTGSPATRWLAVGTPRSSHQTGHGKVVLFARVGAASSWSHVTTLSASDGGGSTFGSSVALGDGWLAAASAAAGRGPITVFRRSVVGAWWELTRAWPSAPGDGSHATSALAAYGESLAVGLHSYQDADGASAVVAVPSFCDGFETGTTSRWSAVAP